MVLKTDYEGLEALDWVYLSKVFTDTYVPENILKLGNLRYGGTGFYYDKAPALPDEVEHHMPDYHLYDRWVQKKLDAGAKRNEYRFYLDYSIGFLTRGCFRKCEFCVNRNYDMVCIHSPLEEFLDTERKKICLLDDNFLGHPKWEEMLQGLKAVKKPFQFRQGLDERLLDDRKCAALFASRYDDTYTFAFDNIADAEVIESKMAQARKYTNARLRFYCFCGFDREDVWDESFWAEDVFGLFKRIEILMRHQCLPYVMRFNRYVESPFRGVYVSVARWANQPGIYKKKSLREFADMNGEQSACYRYLYDFERQFPQAAYFYDLVVKLHHIIADGWSMQLVAQMIDDFYMNGDLHFQQYTYSDVEGEIVRYTDSPRNKKDHLYWQRKCHEIEMISNDGSINSNEAHRKTFFLKKEISRKIQEYVSDNHVTKNQFFLFVYHLLLNYINNKDVQYIGVPIYNRRNKESKNTIGMYTNMIPMILTLDKDQTLEDNMKALKQNLYEAMKHSQFSFASILDQFEGIKSECTYQYVFNYFNMSFRDICCGCQSRVENVFPGAQPYMLQLLVYEWEKQNGIGLSFDYSTENYTEEQIAYYFSLYEEFCQLVIENTDKKWNELLSVDEKALQDLAEYNDTVWNYGKINIFQQFMDQVKVNGERIAVCDGEQKFSYEQMLDMVKKYISCLLKNNVGEGDFVWVHASHYANTLSLIWAIVYVGAIFVPIEKKWPDNKKKVIFENTKPRAIFSDEEYIVEGQESIPLWYAIAKEEEAIVYEKEESERPLYILYTSGTTGAPKGVLVSNSSLYNYLAWAKREYQITDSDTLPLFSSIAFDFTLTTIFLPFTAGARVAIYRESGVQHPIYQIMEDNQSTVVKVTPSHMNIMASEITEKSRIRAFIIGGEKLYSETIEKMRKRLNPDVKYFNEYGPTEATIGCMTYLCKEEEDDIAVPIGRPIHNTEIYLLDQERKPVGKYKWAEMYIAGDCLAIEYFHNPDQTNKSYVTSPFLGDKRLYKTGDIARFNAKNELEYLGRNDSQVKIHGYRIEMDEIYSAIMEMEEIDNCAVEIVKENGAEYIVGYLVSERKNTDDFRKEIYEHFHKHLVHYMIPRRLIFVEQIPLTTNGKIDLSTLGEIRKSISEETLEEKLTVLSEREHLILKDICHVFDKKEIKLTSSFVKEGGDSIKAILLTQRLYQRGYSVNMQDIMYSNSFLELVNYMKMERQESEGYLLSKSVEFTPIVSRFVALQDLWSNDSNHEVVIRLTSEVDQKTFLEVLSEVVDNHPALHFNISEDHKHFVYRERRMETIALCEKDQKQFNVCQDFLLRVMQEDEKTYRLVCNHLVVDYVSWSIMLGEIDYLLSGISDKQRLKKEKLLYEDYALENHIETKSTIFQRKSASDVRKRKTFCYDLEKYAQQVDTLKMKYGMDMKQFLQAVMGYHYNKTFQKPVIFEVETHGRDLCKDGESFDSVVGWFTHLHYEQFSMIEQGETFEQYQQRHQKKERLIFDEGLLRDDVIRFNYLGDFKLQYDHFEVLENEIAYHFSDGLDYTFETDIRFKNGNQLEVNVVFQEEVSDRIYVFFDLYFELIGEYMNYQVGQEILEIEYIDDDISLEEIELLLQAIKSFL